MLSFWVIGEDDQEYPGIIANSLEEAEEIFWQGVLVDDYPFDAHLIEMILDEEDIQIIEEVNDADILSIEEVS